MLRHIYLGRSYISDCLAGAERLIMIRLLMEVINTGVEVRRKIIGDIKGVLEEFPDAEGFVNCTGTGSCSIKGAEDKELYPTMVYLTTLCATCCC